MKSHFTNEEMSMRRHAIPRVGLSRICLVAGTVALLFAATPPPAVAGSFQDIEDDVVEFTLDNGLTFLVLERHVAPVFSFATYVNAGGADELPGITGIAHMFEHMAFKGTQTIGTTDYEKEQEVLDKMDAIVRELLTEKRKGRDADADKIAELDKAFQETQQEAGEFVVTNDFSKVLEENGVQGINAGNALDWTIYHYSLPSNRLELWAMMEGDRLSRPVMREFYKERDVVIEERRMRFDSSPTGRLVEQLLGLAFPAHPYGDGVIGYMADLESMDRADASEFWHKYYVASNITIAVVGDVKVKDVKKFAKKYFSDVPTGPEPDRVGTPEPEQRGERRFTLEDPAQPFIFVGYHIPDAMDPDYGAYELLSRGLGQGRSSRLYSELVKKQKIAADVGAFSGFPGEKYPTLLMIYAMVSAGEDPYEVEEAIYEVIDDLLENPITEGELEGLKTRSMAELIRRVRSNTGLAWALTTFDGLYGSWRRIFHLEEEMAAIGTADLERIAGKTFVMSNRNVAMIVNPE